MAKIKLSGKRRAINIIVIILSICCFIIGAGCVYAESVIGNINFEKAESDDVSKIVDAGGTDFDFGNISADNLYHDPKVMNFVLLGVDDYQKGDTGRSDSMMMVSIDTRNEEIKLTSFMRDTYLSIPGYGFDKLNHAYAYGGPSLTVATLEDNFRVDIDRYIIIDFKKFVEIIDTIGGIDLEITDDEARVINEQSKEDASLALSGGKVHMTGKQARMYSRIRELDDDYERTARQRKVVMAAIDRLKHTDLLTLNSYLSTILGAITTDMTKDEVLGLATNMSAYLNYDVTSFRLPVDGEFYDYELNGGWYLVAYLQENIDILVKYVYGENNIPTLKSSYTLNQFKSDYDRYGNPTRFLGSGTTGVVDTPATDTTIDSYTTGTTDGTDNTDNTAGTDYTGYSDDTDYTDNTDYTDDTDYTNDTNDETDYNGYVDDGADYDDGTGGVTNDLYGTEY